MEQTYVMIKPDGVARQLIGSIVARFEARGFNLIQARLLNVSRAMAEEHYGEHKEKPFFGELVDFITSGPVFAMVWEGDNAVKTVRKMVGSTNPQEAESGTIRGDFALSIANNIIHASDSTESAAREIKIFFNEGRQ